MSEQNRTARAGRAAIAALAGAVVLVSIAHLAYYLPRTVDDLFISLRYARNLVHGLGLVYNPGERVEGFSSPLWVLVQAAGLGLHLEGVAWTKAVGAASLAALIAGLYRLARAGLGISTPWALVPCLAVALNPFVISWSTLGLETPAFLALLLWMPACLAAYLHVSSWGRGLALGAVTLSLILVRPEAPIFVLAAWSAAVFGPPRWRGVHRKLELLVPVGLAVAVAAGACLAARLLYYGDLLPHTFHSKTGHPVGTGIVSYLVGRGASLPEVLVTLGGLLVLLVVALRERNAVPAALAAACLACVALVTEDWMPNNRFLLPLAVLVPLAWAWLADRLWRWRRGAGRALAVAAAVLLVATMADVARIDMRSSSHDLFHFGWSWNRMKSRRALADAIDCLRRREPLHVRATPIGDMGMIMQVFWLLQASDRDLEESWYVGRDIGRVGYYTGARVFDTDGLFTREVARDESIARSGIPDPGTLEAMMLRRPVATEIVGAWSFALGAMPWLLDGTTIEKGTITVPVDVRPAGQGRPTLEVVASRYERLVESMPGLFYMQTLYGQAVGANVEKRARFIRVLASRGGVVDPGDVPPDLPGAGVLLGDGLVLMHGCSVDPSTTSQAGETVLECYLERRGVPTVEYWIFVHVGADGALFTADHLPLDGLMPLSSWPEGAVVRDITLVTVPYGFPPGRYRVHVGLFSGDARLPAAPARLTDGDDRVLGPLVDVTAR